MAGEVSISVTLTSNLIGQLAEAGLTLAVMVDCSHAINVRTIRSDRPGQPIITKPIELDCALSLNGIYPVATVTGKLQAAKSSSPLYQVYSALNGLGKANSPTHGLNVITQRNVKVEFPNFDTTIINLGTAIGNIGDAITACRAANVAAFNALPAHTRRCMGMYRRQSATNFVLNGVQEPGARVAIA
jgi:hypothetical protein